jgi:hypothetical protein
MIQPYDVAIPWQTNLTYFLIIQSFRFICRKKENGSFSFKRKRKMRRAKHPTKSIYIVQKKWIPYILPPLYFGKTYVSKKKDIHSFFFVYFSQHENDSLLGVWQTNSWIHKVAFHFLLRSCTDARWRRIKTYTKFVLSIVTYMLVFKMRAKRTEREKTVPTTTTTTVIHKRKTLKNIFRVSFLSVV